MARPINKRVQPSMTDDLILRALKRLMPGKSSSAAWLLDGDSKTAVKSESKLYNFTGQLASMEIIVPRLNSVTHLIASSMVAYPNNLKAKGTFLYFIVTETQGLIGRATRAVLLNVPARTDPLSDDCMSLRAASMSQCLRRCVRTRKRSADIIDNCYFSPPTIILWGTLLSGEK